MKLTARAVQQAKPTAKQYDLPDGNGLYLRVFSTGAKSWLFRCKVHGRPERKTLGHVPSMSLADARKAAAAARELANSGTSPAAEAQRLKHERRVMPTVADFSNEYIKLHAKPNKKSWLEDRRTLDNWILPEVGKMKLGDLHRRDVVAVVDKVREAGHVRMPGKVLAVFRRMLRFAVERGVIEISPAVYVSAQQPKAITHALTHDEIRQWWAGTFDEKNGPAAARLALRLLLLTGQRGSEVGGIELSEIDLDAGVWNLPGGRRKMGHSHRIPLSDASTVVIRKAMETVADKAYLFPNRWHTGGVRVDGALPGTLERIFAGADRIPTTHDARRTVATELAECLEISEEGIAAVLGHQPRTVTGSYIKSRERMARAPLAAWARHLEGIVSTSAEGRDNVVAIGAR